MADLLLYETHFLERAIKNRQCNNLLSCVQKPPSARATRGFQHRVSNDTSSARNKGVPRSRQQRYPQRAQQGGSTIASARGFHDRVSNDTPEHVSKISVLTTTTATTKRRFLLLPSRRPGAGTRLAALDHPKNGWRKKPIIITKAKRAL